MNREVIELPKEETKLQDGCNVIYEYPAKFEGKFSKDNKIPEIEIGILKVKKVVFEGLKFIDQYDQLRNTYRIRNFINADSGEKIKNSCYDFFRIDEDTKRILEGDAQNE